MPASKPEVPGQAGGDPVRTHRGASFLVPFLAGLAHALLLGAAFAPVGIWPAALVSPLPLIWAVTRCGRSPARLAAFVGLGMLPLHLYEYHWVFDVAALGYVPLAVIICGLCSLFIWAAARIRRRFPNLPLTWLVPILWTGVEVFRGEVFFTGYPWLLLGHPLIDAPWLAQPAGVVGAYGVSFLCALGTGIIADWLWNNRPCAALAGAAVLAVVYAGSWALRPKFGAAPTIRIAVVQTNIPQDNKNEWTSQQRFDDFLRFEELTRRAAAGKPDLIVWPETMFPGSALDPAAVAEQRAAVANLGAEPAITLFNDRLCALQAELKVPLMVGAIGVDKLRITRDTHGTRHAAYDSLYNSVFLLRDGAVQPMRYDKIVLTPFGEVMPYIQHWPWLQRQLMALAAGGLTFDLSAGQIPRVFRLTVRRPEADLSVAVATPICFEATKSAVCRSLVGECGSTPCILLNLTNDGWFGTFDPARWQHMQIARWRAVELNTPIVRAANTGVSTAIDARGQVLKRGVDGSDKATQVDGVLTTDIPLGGARTIYSRTGDVLGWCSLAATGLMLAATFKGRTKESA